jgi:hypothetical protein
MHLKAKWRHKRPLIALQLCHCRAARHCLVVQEKNLCVNSHKRAGQTSSAAGDICSFAVSFMGQFTSERPVGRRMHLGERRLCLPIHVSCRRATFVPAAGCRYINRRARSAIEETITYTTHKQTARRTPEGVKYTVRGVY